MDVLNYIRVDEDKEDLPIGRKAIQEDDLIKDRRVLPDGEGDIHLDRLPVTFPVAYRHNLLTGKLSNPSVAQSIIEYHPTLKFWVDLAKYENKMMHSYTKKKHYLAEEHYPLNPREHKHCLYLHTPTQLLTQDDPEEKLFFDKVMYQVRMLDNDMTHKYYETHPDEDPSVINNKWVEDLAARLAESLNNAPVQAINTRGQGDNDKSMAKMVSSSMTALGSAKFE